jgi:hypothetical protein
MLSDDIMIGLVCQQSAGLLECWIAGLEESVLFYFVNLLVGKLSVSGYCAWMFFYTGIGLITLLKPFSSVWMVKDQTSRR